MIITIEISHYPLKDHYEDDIIDFIHRIKTYDDIVVVTNPMSTQVKGEFSLVFSILKDELIAVFEKGSMSASVIKIIPKGLPIEDGRLEF
jgi:uncharacterized protein YqgV (UPF0045/DUF77 family)